MIYLNSIKKISTLAILFLTLSAYSQSRNWTTETSKDGKSTVKYELVKEKKRTHFFYIAETTAKITLDELDVYLSNTANHKNYIEGTRVTEEFERISDNEWLSYYYFDAPWPLSNSDLVIKFNRTKQGNKLIFTATAFSSDYKKTKTKRMTNYKVIYEFEKIDDTTTKITYNADYIPAGRIPKFLIKYWFPEGPAGIVTNIGLRK
ncbi:hypothetical protein [Aequorivita marina]|uniref:hypothetical protein n=1 Tax=Aequorivita marina TaxID=3073654 RepID=UPI0028748AAF|nr:hypothetical protein [Aequorivita sp. S2608]MDS1299404.1 hypothetical protein [Aequorivita sp. S2608]